jgi:hypothetical protein
MKKIFKYELNIEDDNSLVLPQGYKILDVQMQWSQLVLWALVDPKENVSMVNIKIYGTGHTVNDNVGDYIGTFQCNGGVVVGHVFEI